MCVCQRVWQTDRDTERKREISLLKLSFHPFKFYWARVDYLGRHIMHIYFVIWLPGSCVADIVPWLTATLVGPDPPPAVVSIGRVDRNPSLHVSPWHLDAASAHCLPPLLHHSFCSRRQQSSKNLGPGRTSNTQTHNCFFFSVQSHPSRHFVFIL